ncbi:MAG: hypothetical protein ABIJ42_06540 [Acidobacteriota bacterium]
MEEGVEFFALGIFLICLTAFLVTIAILYALYVQEVTLDFAKRQFAIRKGFRGFVNVFSGPFSSIEGVKLRKTEMKSRTNSLSEVRVARRWEIGLSCRPESPTFSLYTCDNADSAKYISGSMSQGIGCQILLENAPFGDE